MALLHPGAMGASLGALLTGHGTGVAWLPAGRSPATAARAAAAGLLALGRLDELLARCPVVLSVCPPAAARDVAAQVAAAGFGGLYVDANAVAPDSAAAIGRIVEAAGATFVDGAVIGPPVRAGGATRLYLSGPAGHRAAAWFPAGGGLDTVVLAGPPTAASALKMCYAAWSKGTQALVLAVRAAARAHQVDEALLAEWERSQPDLAGRSDTAVASAAKAWRWSAEMAEIAATFASAGLPPGFHRAAAEIFDRLAGFRDGDAELAAVLAALRSGS